MLLLTWFLINYKSQAEEVKLVLLLVLLKKATPIWLLFVQLYCLKLSNAFLAGGTVGQAAIFCDCPNEKNIKKNNKKFLFTINSF